MTPGQIAIAIVVFVIGFLIGALFDRNGRLHRWR